jgi:multidrug efflux pump subunit AcrA (membrane-fusion protein)
MYHVDAQFQFDANDKRKLDVPFDGQIEAVYALPGNLVKKDQVLLKMRTFDLQLELNKALDSVRKADAEYRKDIIADKLADAEIARHEMDAANAEVQLNQDKISRGEVRAPFDGVVLASERDLMDERNVPKKEGDELFVIASSSSLRAELSVGERDIQQVSVGQHGQLATTALPNDRFPFTIDRVVPLPETKEGDNTFTVFAHLDQTSPSWRPGMAGEARVEIAHRRLIWIWTHKFADYLKFKLWM